MDRARAAIVVVPLAAFATLGVGLRVGASDALRGAVVYAAPVGSDAQALAWQVATLSDDQGVREALALPDLTVTATRGADTAEWRGASNADGIAEVRLTLPDLREGDAVRLAVRAGGVALADGRTVVPPGWKDVARTLTARATKRDGAIVLDVAPLGGRLAVGFPGSLWVRATDGEGHPLEAATIDVEPEPGLEVAAPRVATCASGWAEIIATPTFHTAGLSLHARAAEADGLWYGAVPVAGGASHVAVPLRLPAWQARTLDVFAAGTRGAVYAEVDDARGRIAAQILDAPRGGLALPALAPGLYWLVTSSEPRGAELLAGASLARPVLVEAPASARGACDVGAALVAGGAVGFPREIALDGFADQRARARGRHRLGATIGLASLIVAAALEALLLLRAAQRGAGLSPALTRRAPAGSFVLALLAGMLGFALLAALLLYRGT